MSYFKIDFRQHSSIQEAINTIPAGVTNLDLGENDLGSLTVADLVAIFASIPKSVRSLDLYKNRLGSLQVDDLVTVFRNFPQGITSLGLALNAGLEEALSSIPDGVTHLDLRSNLLGNRGLLVKLDKLLSGIPMSVSRLDLSYNFLNRMLVDNLVSALSAIPAGVKSLYLGYNNLNKFSGMNLSDVLRGISGSVTHLDLSHNHLDFLSGADLGAAFASIPISVTYLNLRNNNLGNLSGDDLKTALSGIPAGVTHLDLSSNDLEQRSSAELAAALARIPQSVRSLDLADNDLGKRSEAELATLLAYIPNTLKEVRLAGLASKSEAYLKEAFSGLHRNGITISFEGERIFTPGDREANDALLKKLRSVADGRSLCFTNTGESDLWRGMSTLLGLSQQFVITGTGITDIPPDVIDHIASFLVSQGQAKDLTALLNSDIITKIMGRESENTNREACIINTIDLSEVGLSMVEYNGSIRASGLFDNRSEEVSDALLSMEK